MHRRMQQGERLGGTIVLALTAGEETTNEGMAEILDHLRPLDAAIVGEPTGLTPMIAQRGLLILKGIARAAPIPATHPRSLPKMPWLSPPRTCCACRNSTGAPVIRSLAGHTAT